MSAKPQFGVVLFHTNSAALRAEKILLRAAIPVKLIPTPREFSSDCGVAVRFEWSMESRVRQLLESAQLESAAMHVMKA